MGEGQPVPPEAYGLEAFKARGRRQEKLNEEIMEAGGVEKFLEQQRERLEQGEGDLRELKEKTGAVLSGAAREGVDTRGFEDLMPPREGEAPPATPSSPETSISKPKG